MAPRPLSVLLPLLLCLAGLVGILLLCIPTRDLREPPAYKYGIVLDAGSSHTAMFVYKWPADKENDTGIVSQHSACDVKGGGISSYEHHPFLAGRSLLDCLNQALRDVPKDRHAVTPLYLGATAGMRLLHLANPAASEAVLDSVTQTLRDFPFDFRGAKILSGEDEGVFGWVTANYLLENFIKYGWIGQWVRPKRGTVGAMDLGGASTQITFETAGPLEEPAREVRLRLYGQPYTVYTNSFLCYGRDQMLKRLMARVLQTERVHPCWPKGYSAPVTVGEAYESPCTAPERPRSYEANASVTLRGAGNPGLCRVRVASLFNFSACPYSHCSFDGVFQPDVTGGFIAFSAFYYTVDFLRSGMKLPVRTPEELEAAANTVCNQTWDELLEKAPREQKRLRDYCAGAMFIHQLITKAYKFDQKTFPNIVFQKKAGDTSIGWALGYMLNLTNMIPADHGGFRKGSDYSSWVALNLLFVLVIVAAVLMLCCLLQPSKEQSAI
ncbi:ectonucleoside triphosphate diphosphohydrolase 2 [Ornithorhynchus anatinus]|uniref:ectonucleoside triphosphate diphosphohydrolase 2 n=1 Tax=Ornithorhynchus anatinus TaxID=9258 RepID=UPI0010A8C025|nr:ectonucleoside triphosphate diphosphohydrolase 2 [Ornithorhynchus anatinus]